MADELITPTTQIHVHGIVFGKKTRVQYYSYLKNINAYSQLPRDPSLPPQKKCTTPSPPPFPGHSCFVHTFLHNIIILKVFESYFSFYF